MVSINDVWKQHLQSEEDARKDQQEKLYHYYMGHKTQIIKYLEKALNITFDADDITEYQKHFFNVTQKIVNGLAILYKETPDRKIISKDGTVSDEATEYYDSIMPLNLNTMDKRQHRLGKLWGASLTQVGLDKKLGRISYKVPLNHNLTIELNEEDNSKIDILMYDRYYKNKKGQEEIYTVVWTDAEHFKLDRNEKRSPVGDNAGMINPYGRIPFVTNYLTLDEDPWGAMLSDVVEINELINVISIFLVNEGLFLGTSGTTLAVNLGLLTKGKGQSGIRKVEVGKKHPIVVEGVGVEMQTPSLSHVTTEPYIAEIKDTIDYYIKMIAIMHGLNPGSTFAGIKDTSDYQKMMDMVEQMEIRRDDIEPCRIYEKERFELTKLVNNVHADTEEGRKFNLKKMKDDLELKVDFAEISIQKTPQEIREDRKFEWEFDISTQKDWMKEDNPDLTDEEIEKILQTNREIKSRTNRKPTFLEMQLKNKGVEAPNKNLEE